MSKLDTGIKIDVLGKEHYDAIVEVIKQLGLSVNFDYDPDVKLLTTAYYGNTVCEGRLMLAGKKPASENTRCVAKLVTLHDLHVMLAEKPSFETYTSEQGKTFHVYPDHVLYVNEQLKIGEVDIEILSSVTDRSNTEHRFHGNRLVIEQTFKIGCVTLTQTDLNQMKALYEKQKAKKQ